MKRFLKIVLRIIGWTVTGLAVLLCLAILLLQTAPMKQQIARIAEQQADNYLNAKLQIGELEGNFFSSIKLKRISLTQENDTLAFIDELNLQYKLWPLLSKQITIEQLVISKPVIRLEQTSDSTWNLTTLVKDQSPAAVSQDEESSFNWLINLQRLDLTSGSVFINSRDSLIPKKIDGINIQLGAKYSSNEQELNLDTFRMNCFQPNISIKQLSFNLRQAAGTASLKQLVLQTNQNKINGEALYNENDASSLKLQTAPLSINEFQFTLPDLKIKVYPLINWTAELKDDLLNSNISLVDDQQKTDIALQAYPFLAWMENPDSVNLAYSINSSFENVKVEEWSGISDLAALLNGKLQVRGKGTDPKTLRAQVNADIHNTFIAGYEIRQLSMQNDYQAGNLQSEIRMKTNFADLSGTAKIQNVTETPFYQAQLQSSIFNLSPFIKDDSLKTNLKLHLSAQGRGFDPQQIKSQLTLLIDPSTIMGIPFDTAFANIRFANQSISIDSLLVQNQSANVTAKGTYSLKGQSDLTLNSAITSTKSFNAFLPDTFDVATNANIQAHLWGTTDSLQIQASASLQNTKYEGFQIENASLDTDGHISAKDFIFKTVLNVNHLKGSGFVVDSIAAASTIHRDSLELEASVRNDFLNTKLNAAVNWQKELKLKLNRWLLTLYNQQWELQQPSELTIDNTSYQISQFELKSKNNETINIDGVFDQQGTIDIQLNADQLQMAALLQPMELGTKISGLTRLKVALSGTARQPILNSQLSVDSLNIDGFDFQQAEASLNYANSSLTFNSDIALNQQGAFTAKGTAPLHIDLSDMKTNFSADSNISINAEIKELPLALIQPFIHTSEVSGLINGAFKFEGSLNEPQPSGNFQLDDGNIRLDEFGIDYRNMKFKTTIEKETVSIDTLGITTEEGKLTGGGKLYFDSVFYKGRIKESTLNIHFDKFNPINHKQINMQLSGDANVSGRKDTIVFNGDLSIPKSEIHLPALLNLFGKVYTPEIPTPILVQELEKQQPKIDTTSEALPAIEFTDSIKSNSFSNIIGRIKLKIPKNTWIKDPNLRVELSGDLEVLKHPENIEIFGTINVVRGQYELFGRTFIVSEGTVTFEGGEEINPRISVTATYTIKNRDSESKTLAVTAGGSALEPTVSFTLDDETITEGDALSYIIFGRGLNELSVSEQDDVSSVTGETVAKSAAASLLASQLTRFLGSKINVDYIEVKSQDNFDNASLEVGKYLTSDIFVSYEQQFGNTDDDLSRYEVKLEYEIFRFLFLQLNNSSVDSGFDVIFKVQAK